MARVPAVTECDQTNLIIEEPSRRWKKRGILFKETGRKNGARAHDEKEKVYRVRQIKSHND